MSRAARLSGLVLDSCLGLLCMQCAAHTECLPTLYVTLQPAVVAAAVRCSVAGYLYDVLVSRRPLWGLFSRKPVHKNSMMGLHKAREPNNCLNDG